VFTILEKIKDHEDTGAWITCLWAAACVVMPLVTVAWSLGSGYAWLWEGMCIVIWAGLFWWTGGSPQAQEAAACMMESKDDEDLKEGILEKYVSR
jgi:hypothetical protein